MIVQLFLYLDRYPTSVSLFALYNLPLQARHSSDPPYLKGFVISLFALDAINSVFVMVWYVLFENPGFLGTYENIRTYKMLIDNFMNPAAFITGILQVAFVNLQIHISYHSPADWIVCTDPIISGFMASMVQGFFAWRVWVLTRYCSHSWSVRHDSVTMLLRNPLYFGFVVLCAIASTGGGFGTGIYAAIIGDFSEFRKIKAVALIWLISGALGDLAITLITTNYLRKARGTFPRTDRLLTKLIRREWE